MNRRGLRHAVLAAILAAALVSVAAQAQAVIEPMLAAGEDVETRLTGDFNADGQPDLAYVARRDDERQLRVALSFVNEFELGAEVEEKLTLPPTSLGPALLKFQAGVLILTDLTGGTTATNTVYRFRKDKAGKPGAWMRLIGLDTALYSRTWAHDGFELSWNLLTGTLTSRTLRLNKGGGDAGYLPTRLKAVARPTAPVWLADTPDPDELIREVSGR